MRWTLLRLARVVTPNIPEAEVLAKMSITSLADMREAARRIAMLKPAAVVIKGGHLAGPEVVDVLLENGEFHECDRPAHRGPNTHGTGCTFAVGDRGAPRQGRGAERRGAGAPRPTSRAPCVTGIPLGKGHRPLNHFWRGIY